MSTKPSPCSRCCICLLFSYQLQHGQVSALHPNITRLGCYLAFRKSLSRARVARFIIMQYECATTLRQHQPWIVALEISRLLEIKCHLEPLPTMNASASDVWTDFVFCFTLRSICLPKSSRQNSQESDFDCGLFFEIIIFTDTRKK